MVTCEEITVNGIGELSGNNYLKVPLLLLISVPINPIYEGTLFSIFSSLLGQKKGTQVLIFLKLAYFIIDLIE